MLDMIRRAQPAVIKGVLGAVVIAFVATIFLEWGWRRQGSLDTHLATVGAEVISLHDYQLAYDNLVNFYRRLYQDRFNEEFARTLNLKQQALDILIQRKILLSEAKQQGLTVTDAELIEKVQSYPVFQVNGTFDRERYMQVLRSNRLTPGDFEQSQREELLLAKLENLIKDSIHVAESEVRDAFARDKEQVNVAYLRVDPAQFADHVEVHDTDLTAYYQEHQERFRKPEQVRVAYVVIDPQALLGQVQVTDEQVASYYEAHKEEFRREAQVRARHILRKVPAGAGPDEEMKARAVLEAVQQRLQAGEDFAALAREFSEDPASAEQGGDLGFFKRGEMVKPFEDAAFALRPGEVSQIVRTDFGYHLIQVEEVQEAGYRPLEEVRSQLVERLAQEEVKRLAETKAQTLYEALTAPEAQWEAVVSQSGFSSRETPLMARGQAVEGVDNAVMFAQAAFALHTGDISQPQLIGSRYVVMKLLERRESYMPAFEEVQATVRDALVQERSRALAQQKAEALLSEVQAGKTLEELAAALQMPVEHTGLFARGTTIPTLGRPMEFIAEAFRMAVGEARLVHLQGQPAIAVLTERTPFDAEAYEKERAQVRQRLLRQKRDQMFAQWVDDVRRRMEDRHEVSVNQRLLMAL
jgi:peptidyl-prolyl cis-trans isomerase D